MDATTPSRTIDTIRPASTYSPIEVPPVSLPRPAPRSSAIRPVLQPFDEIYAEVEAEFAGRDRSSAHSRRGFAGLARGENLASSSTGGRLSSTESGITYATASEGQAHGRPFTAGTRFSAVVSGSSSSSQSRRRSPVSRGHQPLDSRDRHRAQGIERAVVRDDEEPSSWWTTEDDLFLSGGSGTAIDDLLGDITRPFEDGSLEPESDSISRPWQSSRRFVDLPWARPGSSSTFQVDMGEDPDESVEDATQRRVALPPFLFRSLRRWRNGRSARDDADDEGIAADSANYVSDLDLDLSYEGLLALSERIGEARNRGATQASLASGLEKYVFVTGRTREGGEPEFRCGICLEDYAEGEECSRSKKCGHGLHTLCLEVSRGHSTGKSAARRDHHQG